MDASYAHLNTLMNTKNPHSPEKCSLTVKEGVEKSHKTMTLHILPKLKQCRHINDTVSSLQGSTIQ